MDASPRTHVCLECRTVLAPGERCDAGAKHRAVDVRADKGRRRLVDRVWGSPAVRLRAKEIARAGGAGGGAGALGQATDCSSCSGCDVGDASGEAIVAILVVALAAIAAVVLYWIVKAIVQLVRQKMAEPTAKGAFAPAPQVPKEGALEGRVVGEPAMASPIGAQACVAYGLELAKSRLVGRDVMLRDAATDGFEIALDDGRTVRVPAGRLRLEGPVTWRRRDEATEAIGWVLGVDPKWEADEEFSPIPFDEVGEWTLGPGDRVAIPAEVDTVADPSRAGGYRDAAMALAPVGIPRVRVISKRAADALPEPTEPS